MDTMTAISNGLSRDRLIARTSREPGVLRTVWERWGERAALELMRNPHTPSDVFRELSDVSNPSLSRVLSGATLRRRLRDAHADEVSGAAALTAVASDETRSGAELARLERAHGADTFVALALAHNIATREDTLTVLARHRDHRVREAAYSALSERRVGVSLTRIASRRQARSL